MTITNTRQSTEGTAQNNVNEVVRFERAKKTAGVRTALGIYIAYHNAAILKVAIVAASCLPKEWLEQIENASDKQINALLKVMPSCVKSNLKSVYTLHTGYVLGGNSIRVITPMFHTMETAIATKLAVQAVHRSVQLTEDLDEDKKDDSSTVCRAVRKIGERASVVTTTCAAAHMVTKPQNVAAATFGATAVSFFPNQARQLHDKTDAFINGQANKLPKATIPMLSLAYGIHELYFEYFGPVPYVTEAVMGTELLVSAYTGAKYMLHNITQALGSTEADHDHDD